MVDTITTLLVAAWDYLGNTRLIWLLTTLFVLLVAHLFLLTRRVLRIQGDLWETDRVVREIQDRLRETTPDDTTEDMTEEEEQGRG